VQPPGAAEHRDAAPDGSGRVVRRGRDLQEPEPAPDEGDEIRERAAGVDADEDGRARQEAGFSADFPPSADLVSVDLLSDVDSALASDFSDAPSFLPPFPAPERA